MIKNMFRLSLLLYIISCCSLSAMRGSIKSPTHYAHSTRPTSPITIIKPAGTNSFSGQTPPTPGQISPDSGSDSDNSPAMIKNASTNDLTDLGEVYVDESNNLAKAQRLLSALTTHEKLIRDLVGDSSEVESEEACIQRTTKTFLQEQGWACEAALDHDAKVELNRRLANVNYMYGLKGKSVSTEYVRDAFDQGTKCLEALQCLVKTQNFLAKSHLTLNTLSVQDEKAQNRAARICDHTQNLLALIQERSASLKILLSRCIQTMSEMGKLRFMWSLMQRCPYLKNSEDNKIITEIETYFPTDCFGWKGQMKDFLASHPKYDEIIDSVRKKSYYAIDAVFKDTLLLGEANREGFVQGLLRIAPPAKKPSMSLIQPPSTSCPL